MKYYGQNKLDQYIHENWIRKPFKDGTFLELGAIDGVKFSNTKFFEDNMGFNKGVLIEPDPNAFKRLVKMRPNCQCFNYAVHNTLSEINFLQSNENAVGCIETSAEKPFKERWHKNSNKLSLPAKKLSSILSETDIKYIDFWSLDVEGAELECLKSMDWNIPIGLLCIEIKDTKYDNPDEEKIRQILKDKNFTLVGEHRQGGSLTVINNIFLNKEYFRINLFNE